MLGTQVHSSLLSFSTWWNFHMVETKELTKKQGQQVMPQHLGSMLGTLRG